MVLDHVPERARIVVIGHTRFQADGFGDRNLDVVDVIGVPDRFEQDVGEAQREQVLHRLLAEIVIDAVNPLLGKSGGNRVVDLAAAGEIGTKRLFQPDADVPLSQTGMGEPGDGRLKQAWRCRQENR